MKKLAGLLVAAALLLAGPAAIAEDEEDGWTTYRSKEYGFEMLTPKKAKFVEKEWTGGWAGFEGTYQGVKLYALGKKEEATVEEIEKFGVKVTKIGEDHWTLIDEGEEDENGWTWFRAYRATHEGKVAYAGIGVGPKGSYLLVLETSTLDDEVYGDYYSDWYQTLKVF